MGTFVYLVCVTVASFVVLAHPAGAQGANTTLPLTYRGRVLQGGGSQTLSLWGTTRDGEE